MKWKVKSLKWSDKLSNKKRSEVIKSEVNEAKWSGMRWSEVQYRKGGGRVFVEKVYRVVTDEKWRAGVKVVWIND